MASHEQSRLVAEDVYNDNPPPPMRVQTSKAGYGSIRVNTTTSKLRSRTVSDLSSSRMKTDMEKGQQQQEVFLDVAPRATLKSLGVRKLLLVLVGGLIVIFTLAWKFDLYEQYFEESYNLPDGTDFEISNKHEKSLTQLSTLSKNLLPSKHAKDRRLAIIGDVHGCIDELKHLLKKINHDKNTHIVLAGDLVTKGPHSLKILDLAIDIGASCVRGNHDDAVMRTYHALQAFDSTVINASDVNESTAYPHHSKEERKLAAAMHKRHAAYLDSCPLILKADIPSFGLLNIVHAGLMPGVKLLSQDPFVLMNMRTIDKDTHKPSESRDGIHWAEYWNRYQKKQKEPTTVVYGHDARRGLTVKKYSIGLDSNCVRGKRLSALVIEGGLKPKEYIASVGCKKYA